MAKSNRDNFSELVKRDLKDRVGSHCSNPDCDVLTITASDESNNSVNNTGIAAHICAAASGKGTRRYKASMTSEQRSAIENGIWLCASCATMIDRDEIKFTEELLQQWKAQAEERSKSRHGKKLYDQQEIDAIVQSLIAKHHLDSQAKNEQIKGLTTAITALSQKGELGTAAIDALKNDNPSLAKELFKLETQRAEMAAKQGAEAYRNLGALAFLDNTQEALAACQRAITFDPDNADGWNQLGHLLVRVGELDQAIAACQTALKLGQAHQDQQEVAMAYGNLGNVYDTRGELDKAVEMYNKALAINLVLGKKEDIALNYGNLGNVYLTRGDLDKAFKMYSIALAINQVLGRKESIAFNYGNLGLVYKTLGDLDKAVEMHSKALAINQELGNKEGIALNYGNLGNVYRNLNKAIEMYQKSLTIHKELDSKEGLAADYGNLGKTYRIRGDFNKAIEMYQKSLAISESVDIKITSANQYANLGDVYKQKGNKAEAKRYWQKSIELYKTIGSPNEKLVQSWLDNLK